MLNVNTVRSHFPALAADTIYFDNPGGTQVAGEVIQRMQRYLQYTNANHGGEFRTSHESDATVADARQAVADFLHAARPEEIVFGPNMTTLTLSISRSLARTLQPGDEIVVTRLDHDANVAPWLLVAEDRGCTIRWVDFRPDDCTLDMESLEQQINGRTKIVAVGYASNAVGTINDVRQRYNWRTRWGQFVLWMRYSMRLTGRLMCRRSIVTCWPVPPTNSLARTLAFSTANMTCSTA